MPEASAAANAAPTIEVPDAIDAMSGEEQLRLLEIAKALSNGTDLERDDLFQEAVKRALAGKRGCPRNVGIVVFLTNAMRSIAYCERKKRKRKRAEFEEAWKDIVSAHASSSEEAQAAILLREETTAMVNALENLFSDDVQAQFVLMGIFDRVAPDEICSWNGMSRKQYDSVRRRIRRRIDEAFPEGWK